MGTDPIGRYTFLTPLEVAELTGIKSGRNCKTREKLQIESLRACGNPFWTNARGRPIIARAAVEGREVIEVVVRKKRHPLR